MTAVAPLPSPELPAGTEWLARTAGQDDDVASSSAEPSDRRILLLTAAYPPRTEVGAARWEGFTPYLVAVGWGVDVVIEHPRDLADPDWGRMNRLPADVRVAAAPRRRPRWHTRLLRLRGALRRDGADDLPLDDHTPNKIVTEVAGTGGPRALVRDFVETAVLAQQSRQCSADFADVALALSDRRHRVVVSSGPPHYVHVAAARVAERRQLPHVVDLRDPWPRTRAARFVERLLPDTDLRDEEATTLARAALIITNTDAAARTLGERFPSLRARILCIPNGTDVPPILPAGSGQRTSRFQIAHAGSLYLDRDPRPFLRAVGRFRARMGIGPDGLRVVFMGVPVRIGGRSLEEHAADAGLADVFHQIPYGTREAARDLLRESAVGVVFQGETRTQVPAKVFEYMAFPLWLLALVGADSATAELLAGTDAIVHDIDDEEGTERSLERCYEHFRAGVVPRPVGFDGRFSRERQAQRLIDELHRLVH